MADLDERPARATLQAMAAQEEWRADFVRAVLDRLEQAHRSLDGHHVKALIVAARQEHARLFQEEINRQMRARGLSPLAEVATSDEENAEAVLESFKSQRRVGVLCTVDMAGEGYDCPEIAVVGFASNKLTTLYVRQVVARAMRVTDIERKLGRVLIAALVVPDVKILIDTLVEYLAPFMHEVLVPDERPRADRDVDGESPMIPMPRYVVADVQPDSESVTVSHAGEVGTFDADLVARFAVALERFGVPGIYAPRVLQAGGITVGDLLEQRPFDPLHGDAAILRRMANPDKASAITRDSSIETQSTLLQSQCKRLEGWWVHNGDVSMLPVGKFIGQANQAAGLPIRGGRAQATPEQLAAVLAHERRVITTYCAHRGVKPPRLPDPIPGDD
jgi:hypothetical protein